MLFMSFLVTFLMQKFLFNHMTFKPFRRFGGLFHNWLWILGFLVCLYCEIFIGDPDGMGAVMTLLFGAMGLAGILGYLCGRIGAKPLTEE